MVADTEQWMVGWQRNGRLLEAIVESLHNQISDFQIKFVILPKILVYGI